MDLVLNDVTQLLNRDKLSTYDIDTLKSIQTALSKKIPQLKNYLIIDAPHRIDMIHWDEGTIDTGTIDKKRLAERIKEEKENIKKTEKILENCEKRLEIVNQLLSEKEESSSFVRKGGKSRKSRKGGKSRKGRKSRKSRRKY